MIDDVLFVGRLLGGLPRRIGDDPGIHLALFRGRADLVRWLLPGATRRSRQDRLVAFVDLLRLHKRIDCGDNALLVRPPTVVQLDCDALHILGVFRRLQVARGRRAARNGQPPFLQQQCVPQLGPKLNPPMPRCGQRHLSKRFRMVAIASALSVAES